MTLRRVSLAGEILWMIATAVLAVVGLWAVSVPSGYFVPVIVAVGGLAAVTLLWAVHGIAVLVIALVAARRGRLTRSPGAVGAAAARWAVVLVLLLATVVVVGLDGTRRVRFAIDRDELTAYAQLALAGGESPVDGREGGVRVGTLTLDRVVVADGGVALYVRDTGLLGRGGYAYFPDASPPEEWDPEPIDGPWYLVTEPFGLD